MWVSVGVHVVGVCECVSQCVRVRVVCVGICDCQYVCARWVRVNVWMCVSMCANMFVCGSMCKCMWVSVCVHLVIVCNCVSVCANVFVCVRKGCSDRCWRACLGVNVCEHVWAWPSVYKYVGVHVSVWVACMRMCRVWVSVSVDQWVGADVSVSKCMWNCESVYEC